jgi:glycosyltransferase involved in cell wall biosynthesis
LPRRSWAKVCLHFLRGKKAGRLEMKPFHSAKFADTSEFSWHLPAYPNSTNIRMNNEITDSTRRRPYRAVLHYWGRRGGGSHVTLLLADHLKNADLPIKVTLSLTQQNADIEAFKASGLPILTIDRPSLATAWRKAWSLPKQLTNHANTLASINPDVVVMTMNSPFAWPFIRALQRRGLRVVYIAHDAEPHPGDYAATWQRVTQDLLIKGADRVVTLSKSVTQRLAERIPASASKTSVIPLESIYPTKQTHLPDRHLVDEPVRLLFYGRLLPYKGLDLLVQALQPLKTDPRWRLTIAGSGPLEAEVRRALAHWSQVDLEHGWITDERTAELFSSHHLLLCPYTEASQSGVIAEALSWAMPSLVMPSGALPEQVGHGAAGLIAQPGDAEGFGRTLQSVLDHPNSLAALSRGAAKLLVERRSQDEWVKLIEAMAHS